MDISFPPPPPSGVDGVNRKEYGGYLTPANGWERVESKGTVIPCQRSLHAGAVWRDNFIVFGGYDGHHRVNDLYSFNFKSSIWNLLNSINAPSPRDRHVAVVYENCLYIFGGFDGTMRVNDLHAYDLEHNEWNNVEIIGGMSPSPRHSHAAVVYQDSMFVFGGYDGSYRSDLHEFNFNQQRWFQVQCGGDIPRARYRGTCVVSENSMILHGGHDGNRHLQDTHVFDFTTLTWSTLVTEGPIPSPRDSHVSVIYDKSMYLYGGSTGSAMGDFHELRLEFRRVWSPVHINNTNSISNRDQNIYRSSRPGSRYSTSSGSNNNYQRMSIGATSSHPSGNNSATGTPSRTRNTILPSDRLSPSSNNYRTLNQHQEGGNREYTNNSSNSNSSNMLNETSPGVRFCHVGVVYDSAFYIFGGYDGSQRLNDFLKFRFGQNDPEIDSPPSSLITDLKGYVNNEVLSDVQFLVEGIPVHAHKILCLRCPFFSNLLTGEYMESRAREIVLEDVKYGTFLLVLQFIYCDEVDIDVDTAMDLFQAADRFGLERLKRLCELEMLSAISVDSAAHILFTADQHNAENLRERCLSFILHHFDEVTHTAGFEEMGRTNVDLVFEILRRR